MRFLQSRPLLSRALSTCLTTGAHTMGLWSAGRALVSSWNLQECLHSCGAAHTFSSHTAICEPRREYTSWIGETASTALSSSSSKLDDIAAGGEGGSRVQFATPRSHTHEGLAYAACPVCGIFFHMHRMFTHLTAVHKGIDHAHAKNICAERLQLYRKLIGSPLPHPGGMRQTSDTARVDPFASSAHRTRTSAVWVDLPTITKDGEYLCNWCVVKGDPFRTRDAFLMHVSYEHPTIDLDEVEKRVAVTASASAARDAGARAPQIKGSSTLNSKDWTQHQQQQPTRRLYGVAAAVTETIRDPVKAQPRQSGVSIPHSLHHIIGRGPTSSPVQAAQTVAGNELLMFTEGHFPCELCGKCLRSEAELLQHLEGRHPDGNATPLAVDASQTDATDGDSRASNDVAEARRSDATTPGTRHIAVVCDMCTSPKVYTTQSALYAHLRFKHSREDASLQVCRLIELHKNAKSFACLHCTRVFTTEEALAEHQAKKHPTKDGIASLAAKDSDAASLPQVTAKNVWWCNQCERGFSSAKGLHGHMTGKHQLPTQLFPCPACRRTFTDMYSLMEHMTLLHTGINFADLGLTTHATCSNCGRFFLTEEEAHAHAVKHHNKSALQPVRYLQSSPGATTSTGTLTTAQSVKEARKMSKPEVPRKVERAKRKAQ